MKKLFILGHFGGFNTGDEAMLGGYLSTLPDTRDVTIKYKNGVDVDWGRNRTLFHGSYTNFIDAIGPDDTLVLCGGTHYHDDYNPARLLRHWLYLSRINYLFARAKRRGASTLCLGNGFGPVRHRITRLLTRQFAKRCDEITVRDGSSARMLASLNIRTTLTHPDMAMLLYNHDQPVPKENMVGVSLTSLQAQQGKAISDDALVHAIADELTAFSVAEKGAVRVRLFVIRSGQRESDEPITQHLHQLLQQRGVDSDVYVFANDLNELLAQMKACRVLLASRFHSAVLGTVTQNRLIILSYHQKLRALAEEINLSNRYVIDLQRSDALRQLAGLSDTVSDLYWGRAINYIFPEAAISQLANQIRALHEKSVDIRVHPHLRRAAQSGKSAVQTPADPGL